MPSWDQTFTLAGNARDLYAAYANYARLCKETVGEHLPFINTPQTAADMNSILDAIGQDKLHYYGTSYGTVLGTTYAQLYPERVGKMVLDGAVNYQRYWTSTYASDTVDVDRAWEAFATHCLAERATCSLADGYTNASTLTLDLQRKLDAMDLEPPAVYFNATAYGILRGSDIRRDGVFSRIYTPSRWTYLARSLAYLLQNNYTTPYLHLYGGVAPKGPFKHQVGTKGRAPLGGGVDDAYTIIALGDKSPLDQLTRVKHTSKEIADAFVPHEGYFAQDIDFDAPFVAENWLLPRSHNLVPADTIKTANPVLILSTRLDPVTPLRGAQTLEKTLQGSVLLVQDSVGHTTISKASRCTAGHVRKYFNGGELPPSGTTCVVDNPNIYFPDPDLIVSMVEESAGTDLTLDQALHKLTEVPDQLVLTHMRRF